jgi:hypothetical protein
MFDRDKVIQELINADVDFIPEDEESDFIVKDLLATYLREGFKGYNNMSDEELMEECNERDISYLFGEDDDIQRLKDERNGLYPDAWDIAN